MEVDRSFVDLLPFGSNCFGFSPAVVSREVVNRTSCPAELGGACPRLAVADTGVRPKERAKLARSFQVAPSSFASDCRNSVGDTRFRVSGLAGYFVVDSFA